MEGESCVPPGFRFHPTEEELVGYYLKRKMNSLKIDLDVIVDIDLYRIEPWDIQDRCKLGYEEQNEWYFFSHKDRKYPTGRRTNRATGAGFWKATGRDKAVVSKEDNIIGMRKTLVFYKGRAPNGMKTDWIMHEYRLQSSEHELPQEEGWVVCRAFKKPSPNQKQGFDAWSNGYFFGNNPNNFSSPSPSSSFHGSLNPLPVVLVQNQNTNFYQPPLGSSSQDHHFSIDTRFDNEITDLPQLDSPSFSTSLDHPDQEKSNHSTNNIFSDWKNNSDKFFAPKMVEPSLFSFPNMPLIPCDDELDAQNHMNHLLGCFPDL